MRNEELRIGIFDSGLGGLTVVKALSQVIKGAELFYIADTKNAPYGEKTTEEILDFSLKITQYFIDTHQITALIVACNTATSAAIKTLRETYPKLIVIGTEPGIKPAIEKTKSGNIGVLATPATLKGDKYKELANNLSAGKDIVLYEQACPGLVEQIENGEIKSQKTKSMLEKWLNPMKENNVDTIVLGCTHYPLVADIIEEIMERKIEIIQTGHAIAKRLLVLSQEEGHSNSGPLNIYLYATDNIDTLSVYNILNTASPIKFISI
ncbi:MAG: glutamate racemase [Sulfurovum sp.]|nr:glutamate racemase [Sulfurovum sp.]